MNACRDCTHFHDFGDEPGCEPDGECRRYPPNVTFFDDGKMRTYFPEVYRLAWCGEFRPGTVQQGRSAP